MARGKIKYKDVVGGGQRKGKGAKKEPKPRKTYSLLKKDFQTRGRKRKTNRKSEAHEHKRPKQEPPEARPPVQEASSESEEEAVDYMQVLRQNLGCARKNKTSLAIDTSDESSDEEETASNEDNQEEGGNLDEDNEDESSDAQDEEAETPKPPDERTPPEEDESDNARDPFVRHVTYDLHESLLDSLRPYPPLADERVETWPRLGRIFVTVPKCDDVKDQHKKPLKLLEERKAFASAGTAPTIIDPKSVSGLFIKTQIVGNLARANPASRDGRVFTELQAELFSVINNYQDLYYPERDFDNGEEVRFVYCLHALNHVLKTRLKVVHHNARMAGKDEVPDEFRDQGLVRPKVLIVVPFKGAAYKIVKMISDMLFEQDKGNVVNKKRFLEEYTGDTIVMPKKNPKPEDYQLMFAGNTDDNFRIGLTVTKKSLKLYADFYSSDVIVASPLGLRTVIGAEGDPDRDYDFLASVELLVLDQTEVFLMQNWDHLLHDLEHLHLQPKSTHDTNYFRVRTWCLDGHAKHYRQTLIFSSVILPEINNVFNRNCSNYAGKVKVSNLVVHGAMARVHVELPHVLHRFEAPSIRDVYNARFDFFVGKVLPQLRQGSVKQTLIYVANYCEYVRLRNYFNREDISFVQICEYSKDGKIARARDMFYHGDAPFLLYTERHHFFKRTRIKGIRHLLFYHPPNFPHFYNEMCNFMTEANMNKKVGSMLSMNVTLLYNKFDFHQLAAILGSERASRLVGSDRDVHMITTGR